jgi:type VI secretion system secreted protein VgrG
MPVAVRAIVGSSSELLQVSVEVHHELNQHGWCFAEFRATNDQRPPAEQWLGQPLTVRAVEEDGTTVIFDGIVWQCELHYDIRAGYNVVVTGVTRSWKLEVTHDQNAFKNKNLSAIATALASADGATAQVSLSADEPWNYLVQWGVPDLRFLVQRTYDRGGWVRTTSTGIEIRDAFDSGHPVQWAGRLTHYAVVGRIGSPASTGTFYDPSNTISKTLTGVTAKPDFLGSNPMSGAVMSASQGVLPSSGLYRQSHAVNEQEFEGRLKIESVRNLSNAFVVGVSGEPRVSVGNLLQIESLPEGNGSCGVIKAVHTWTQADGYKNEFVATLAAKWMSAASPQTSPPARIWQVPDRPGLYPTGSWLEARHDRAWFNDPRTPLRPGGGTCSLIGESVGNSHFHHSQPFLGVVVARVMDNNDPNHLGRLKVQYIWAEEPTDWIRMASPSAGADRGFLFLPEKGDEVLVAFEDGDPNHPIIIGSLWNSANNCHGVRQPFRSPAGIDNNDVKRIVTKGGLRITFSDTPGEQGLTFVTPFGCSIKMLEKHPDTGFPMVAIETATGDIFLGAPEGRVHINSKFYSKEIG